MISFAKCILHKNYSNIQFETEGVCNFCTSSQPPVYRSGALTRPEGLARLSTENNIHHLLLAEIFAKMDLPVEKFFRAVEKAKQAAA